MKIGDKVREVISDSGAQNGHISQERTTGTVVYIHPEWRFYVAEFRFPFGSFRESYFLGARRGRYDDKGGRGYGETV